jgi:hypothetical protein
LVAPKDPTGGRLDATLSAVPNMDLELLVFDLAGKKLAHVNQGRFGEGESVSDLPLPGPFVIMVTQKLSDNGHPIENVSDSYRLDVLVRNLPP